MLSNFDIVSFGSTVTNTFWKDKLMVMLCYPLKVLLCSYLVYLCLYVSVFVWIMRAYLCDAWETDTPFVYSGNTKSGDEMLPTVDYLDISAFNLTILRPDMVMVTMSQGTMIFKGILRKQMNFASNLIFWYLYFLDAIASPVAPTPVSESLSQSLIVSDWRYICRYRISELCKLVWICVDWWSILIVLWLLVGV